MNDPEVTSRKFMVLLGGFLGVGLLVTGIAIKAKDFVLAPQRYGRTTTLSGEGAQEYAFIPMILGAIILIGCVAYWWSEIRPLLGDD